MRPKRERSCNCFLLTLIASLRVWSRRTVAAWRGLRMRCARLLRHGHLFAEKSAHCQSSPQFTVFYYNAIHSLPNLFQHKRVGRDYILLVFGDVLVSTAVPERNAVL